jgi:hypothetical protein
MIEICNLRNEKPVNPWDVRVDRDSVLGNPYFMKDETQRDKVCDDYAEYFRQKLIAFETGNAVASTVRFVNKLRSLVEIHQKYNKLRLFCWCAPKRCHAETIRAWIGGIIHIE